MGALPGMGTVQGSRCGGGVQAMDKNVSYITPHIPIFMLLL
jgi:hypothetical protein